MGFYNFFTVRSIFLAIEERDRKAEQTIVNTYILEAALLYTNNVQDSIHC